MSLSVIDLFQFFIALCSGNLRPMSAIGSLVAATAMPFIRQTFSEADSHCESYHVIVHVQTQHERVIQSYSLYVLLYTLQWPTESVCSCHWRICSNLGNWTELPMNALHHLKNQNVVLASNLVTVVAWLSFPCQFKECSTYKLFNGMLDCWWSAVQIQSALRLH